MPPGGRHHHVLFRDPVAVRALGEIVAEGVLLGRRWGEAWHAEPLQGTPTRQPPTQPEARELLASAWVTFDGGRPLAGPRFRRCRAECGEFVFRQRRDCPTRAKRKASLKVRAPLTTKSASPPTAFPGPRFVGLETATPDRPPSYRRRLCPIRSALGTAIGSAY